MEILKAREMGFCFGVRRAIRRAEHVINIITASDVYMLGEIIHNPQVIKKFKEKGITIVKEISKVPAHKYLITRAHGISKSEKDYAKKYNLRLIDTTCPYVKKLQQIVFLLKKEGYQIVVFGDIDHPEIKSLLSYIDNKALVIQSSKEIKSKKFEFFKKIGLLSQTTKDIQQFYCVIEEIFKYTEELRIFNTICKATRQRQEATEELAKTVDLMLVIGGLNSANTNRLTDLSKKIGVDTYHIEDEKQLNLDWFKDKKRIGITAGASTPDYITKKIIIEIEKLNRN